MHFRIFCAYSRDKGKQLVEKKVMKNRKIGDVELLLTFEVVRPTKQNEALINPY
jgi:hypothetical protein